MPWLMLTHHCLEPHDQGHKGHPWVQQTLWLGSFVVSKVIRECVCMQCVCTCEYVECTFDGVRRNVCTSGDALGRATQSEVPGVFTKKSN